MKKVGIMSMQRVINYGSFLQAFALSSMIKEMGNEVEFVDFEFEKSIVQSHNIQYIAVAEKEFNIMKEKFQNEYLLELGVGERNLKPQLDTLVIGSDEVFHCMQGYPIGYSRQLFGYENKANKVISYAASAGTTTLDKIKEAKIDQEIATLLDKFDNISVRDENTKNLVEGLINKKIVQNLDPVLVYDFSNVIKEKKDLKNYIIVYSYVMRLNDEENEEIKRIAKKFNKKILTIGAYQACSDIHITVHPFELLGYFKNADYVITDTFHGTIFATKFNKQFATIIRESNRQKLEDLLNKLDLNDRKVNKLDELEEILLKPKCFSNTNKILQNERNRTLSYLRDNI